MHEQNRRTVPRSDLRLGRRSHCIFRFPSSGILHLERHIFHQFSSSRIQSVSHSFVPFIRLCALFRKILRISRGTHTRLKYEGQSPVFPGKPSLFLQSLNAFSLFARISFSSREILMGRSRWLFHLLSASNKKIRPLLSLNEEDVLFCARHLSDSLEKQKISASASTNKTENTQRDYFVC